MTVHSDRRDIVTRDGWHLDVKRTANPAALDRSLRPLLIVPGYGMNAFLFGFHPRGTSMERCLADAGFEVWSVNLRGQGASRAAGGVAGPSLRGYAGEDLPAVIGHIQSESSAAAERVDVIGASLGGSIVFLHLAMNPATPVGSIVAIGAPLRWVEAHPALRVAFASRRVAGALRLRGTQRLARVALPWVARIAPQALSIYMNTALVDVGAAAELTRTVEDPHPVVNREIAEWLRSRDLELDGVNVTSAMNDERRPLLLVVANRDGIVPEPTALSARDAWGDPAAVTVLRIGDEREWYAHADLFVGNPAPERVFAPIADWLRTRVAAR